MRRKAFYDFLKTKYQFDGFDFFRFSNWLEFLQNFSCFQKLTCFLIKATQKVKKVKVIILTLLDFNGIRLVCSNVLETLETIGNVDELMRFSSCKFQLNFEMKIF